MSLTVKLLRCERLRDSNKGSTNKACPYVELTVGGLRERSTSAKNTLNPRWDPVPKFVFDGVPEQPGLLRVRVLDESPGKASIGEGEVEYISLLPGAETEVRVDLCHPGLFPDTGVCYLKVTYWP